MNSCKKGTVPINPSRGSFLEAQSGFCSSNSSCTEPLMVSGQSGPLHVVLCRLPGRVALSVAFSVLSSGDGSCHFGHQSPSSEPGCVLQRQTVQMGVRAKRRVNILKSNIAR